MALLCGRSSLIWILAAIIGYAGAALRMNVGSLRQNQSGRVSCRPSVFPTLVNPGTCVSLADLDTTICAPNMEISASTNCTAFDGNFCCYQSLANGNSLAGGQGTGAPSTSGPVSSVPLTSALPNGNTPAPSTTASAGQQTTGAPAGPSTTSSGSTSTAGSITSSASAPVTSAPTPNTSSPSSSPSTAGQPVTATPVTATVTVSSPAPISSTLAGTGSSASTTGAPFPPPGTASFSTSSPTTLSPIGGNIPLQTTAAPPSTPASTAPSPAVTQAPVTASPPTPALTTATTSAIPTTAAPAVSCAVPIVQATGTADPSLLDTSQANVQQLIVNLHNNVRRCQNAANMLKMQWDDVTTQQAQSWANRCVNGHTLTLTGVAPTGSVFNSCGQNIAVGSASWNGTVDQWASEQTLYVYGQNPCPINELIGHITQLTWATSWQVGCGVANCPNLGGMFYVCNYCPPGNIPATQCTGYLQGTQANGGICGSCGGQNSANCDNGLCTNTCRFTNGFTNCEVQTDATHFPLISDISACSNTNDPNVAICAATCQCKAKGNTIY